MHFVRRAALRAASATPSVISNSRSINTSSPFALRSKVQQAISPVAFRRFAHDDAESSENKIAESESADNKEPGAIRSAVDSVAETASEYANQAKETISEAASSVAGAAAGYGIGRPQSGGYEARPPIDRVIAPTSGIYIGNLLFDVTAEDIQREFAPYGNIVSCIIAQDARGLSKGFGYIEYSSIAEAAAAIEARHQTVFEGRRVIVNYMAKTTRENKVSTPSKTLFIGNLAFEMSDADLNKLFRDVRNVIDVRVAIDRRTGQPRGFAHADFVDIASAQKAMDQLSGKEVYGRKLRLDFSLGAREARGAFKPDNNGSF